MLVVLALLATVWPAEASVMLPAPTNLRVTQQQGTVTVSWDSVPGATEYETRWALVDGPADIPDWENDTQALVTSQTHYQQLGLIEGDQWRVRVRGGMNGMYGDAAASTSSSPGPAAPNPVAPRRATAVAKTDSSGNAASRRDSGPTVRPCG